MSESRSDNGKTNPELKEAILAFVRAPGAKYSSYDDLVAAVLGSASLKDVAAKGVDVGEATVRAAMATVARSCARRIARPGDQAA